MKIFVAALVLLSFVQPGWAQTTQPADHGWPGAVNDIAKALVDGDTTSLGQMLTDHSVIRPFDGKADADTARLLDRTTRGTPIGAHAYIHPPLAMAADMAADFKTATIIPDDVRKKMVPDDEEGMKRSNATAIQWVAQALDAHEHDYVAVFVFWTPKLSRVADNDVDTAAPAMQSMFVLIKASEGSAGTFKIDRIVYGHPLEH